MKILCTRNRERTLHSVAEAKRRKQRERIFRALTQRRVDRPSLTDTQLRASRTAGRP